MPNNYVLLERTELNASAASVTFANIPQTGYTDLKVVMSIRRDSSTGSGGFQLRFNGDTGSNYSSRTLYGNGASAGSFTSSGTSMYAGEIGNSTDTASTFSSTEFYIPNYLSGTAKSLSSDSVTENNATTAYTVLTSGLWTGTAAINSIQILPSGSGSLTQYSTFSLYGLAALGTTPTVAPKASGGNVIATDGTYWYHAFLASGTFVPQVGLTADCLVVAGGGGTVAASGAGGGGAGGLLNFASQAISTAQTVTIGAGGAAGSQGASSQFGSLTATVGGGNASGGAGGNGGSGGGGAAATGIAGGTATSGQGFNGGTGATNGSGGGGGSGNAGANGTVGTGGIGGDGTTAYSSWGLATSTGQNVSGTVYYAGGGGGWQNSPRGGYGGGAAQTGAGTVNTGGGGGGYGGGTGGSGIVIIRYLA